MWSSILALAALGAAPPVPALPETASLLLVVSQKEHHLTILRADDLTERHRVPTPEGPHEVVASADGRTAYVMNYGGQQPGRSISVVDVVAGEETGRIDLGALRRPHGLHREGDVLWITTELNNGVARVDLVQQEVDRVLGHGEAGGHMLAFDPRSETLYTANISSHSISAIATKLAPGFGVVRRAEVPPQPEGIALTLDGGELWLGHRTGGVLSVVDTGTLEVTHELEFGGFPYRLAPVPGGAHMLATSVETGELVELDVATKTITRRLPVGAYPAGLCVSPDGRHVAVSLLGEERLAVVDLDSGLVRETEPVGASPDGVAWTVPVALAPREPAETAETKDD